VESCSKRNLLQLSNMIFLKKNWMWL
jgi:hypothetical protein